MDCYVYYRVAPEHVDTVRAAVQRLFATVLRDTGVQGELQYRCHIAYEDDNALDGAIETAPATWMERYDNVPEGFATRLEDLALDAGFLGLTEGPRHLEYFTTAVSE